VHRRSKFAQKVHGLRAKLYNAKRYKEKAQMRKTYVLSSFIFLSALPPSLLSLPPSLPSSAGDRCMRASGFESMREGRQAWGGEESDNYSRFLIVGSRPY